MLVVQKYGGSSVANPQRIKNVAGRVAEYYRVGHRVAVVVSAMGDTTDELLELMEEISPNPPAREIDMLLSTGEQVSIALLAMALNELGVPAQSFTGLQAGIYTDELHTKARITKIKPERITDALNSGKVAVVAGFQGVNQKGDITTLGRGGSDTTAVALAAALKADICEIYTDVDGVYTADPRIVPDARKIKEISYEEMLELASLGAVVLQPRSVDFARNYKVEVHVRSSFNYNDGTVLKEEKDLEKKGVVTGVAHDKNAVKVGVFGVPDQPGVAYRLFSELAAHNINVDMIIQSAGSDPGQNDISFTIGKNDLAKTLEILEELVKKLSAKGYTYDEKVAKVSIVGAGMVSYPGVAAKMFEALYEENINIHMISTSEIKVSCIIDEDAVERAVNSIHKKFELGYST
ncbi:aspartate kinase [Carboxydothermus pertinax]|uniref:Aspartokinase n=1 Tax=Carboxydothermus pertinax TaxID=870242 RepID=A0A1L8CTP3_9THEO|nr:aspartate kinase [Carboxydothermus pertinax]GAV22283.1 aspartate kinase [Carboxydothermus pertinax]